MDRTDLVVVVVVFSVRVRLRTSSEKGISPRSGHGRRGPCRPSTERCIVNMYNNSSTCTAVQLFLPWLLIGLDTHTTHIYMHRDIYYYYYYNYFIYFCIQ